MMEAEWKPYIELEESFNVPKEASANKSYYFQKVMIPAENSKLFEFKIYN